MNAALLLDRVLPRRWVRACAGNGAAMLAVAAAFAAAAVLDPRVLPSAPGYFDEDVWLKPLRFALAFGVHALTLAWIARLTDRATATGGGDRWFAAGAWLQIVVMWLELACIGTQGARGEYSHFNIATPFDSAIFTAMGIGTLALFAGFGLMTVGLLRRPPGRTMLVAVVAAMALAILGGLIGVLMVMATPEQRALIEAGMRPEWIGGHAVGAPSPQRVWLFGWDRMSGDWRIAHFIGIHALQLLPLLAWLAGARGAGGRVAPTVLVGTAAYAGLFVWSVAVTLAGVSAVRFEAAVGLVGAALVVLLGATVLFGAGRALATARNP